MLITTVTQKGQFTIPAPIRKKLAIEAGDKVISEYTNGEFKVRPVPALSSLRGSIKTTRKYNKQAARKAIGAYLAEKHSKSLGYE